MPSLILENYDSERAHIDRLTKLFKNSIGSIKITSPYITDRTLVQKTDQPIHLLLSLSILDIVSGATSIEAISWMIASGIECRILPGMGVKYHIDGLSSRQ